MQRRKVAVIGSGNIGTDLMLKLLRHSRRLEMAVLVGVDAASDGLARARALGVKTLFVLTTRTAHWFKARGFVEQPIDQLPREKRLVYNMQRRSKVFAQDI